MANGNSNEKSYEETLRIPLIVGVTGHRHIKTPEAEIKKQMDRFWEKIREAAGPKTEIILLSSIAEGADHLMVKYRPAGMKYCVVLPFDEKDYRKNYSGTALADFEADLKGAFKKINCKGNPDDYTLASDYVRKHSDVLLTLWDGNENRDSATQRLKRGGTYYQIRKAFGLDDLLIREKMHLIVNLPVTRAEDHKDPKCEYKLFPGFPREKELMVIENDKDDEDAEGKLVFTPFSEYDFGNQPVKPKLVFFAESLKFIYKLLTMKFGQETKREDDFGDLLKYIRNHNESDLPKEPEKKPNKMPKCYLRKCRGRDGKAHGMECYPDALRIVNADFNRHEHFDNIAGMHQIPYRKQFSWIILLTLIVCIFRIFFKCNIDWITYAFILLYMTGAFGVFWLWLKFDRQDHYTKYLEQRIIAELLRLKLFWTLAGIRESFNDHVFDESAGYKFMVPICNWEIADDLLSEEDRKWLDDGNGFAAVKECWLTDQTDYYRRYLLPDPVHLIKPQRDEPCSAEFFLSVSWLKKYTQVYERRDGFTKLLKAICTVGGCISTIILVVVFATVKICENCKIKHETILNVQMYLEYLVPICFLGAAVLGWLMGKKKWDVLSRQYRKVWELFKKARVFFDDNSKDVEDKRQMIKDLVLFAHEENLEWQDLRNNAKPEPMI